MDTIGIIFDQTDGLNFYPDYGLLRDLFADPSLAADQRYADVLQRYLRSETIAPLPLSGSPPPIRTRSTRCSGRSCVSGISAGLSTARR